MCLLKFTSLIGLFVVVTSRAQQPAFSSATISGLGARNIGSAAMSGRISAIAGTHENRGEIAFCRRGQRRRLEIGRRRHALPTGVRRTTGAIDWRDRARSQERKKRLGRNRRVVDAKQRVGRRRHLQIDRWRRDVDARRFEQFGAHRADRGQPKEQRHGLCCRARRVVERFAGSRSLPDH